MVLNNKDSTAIRADYCKSLEEADKLAKELYDHYKELGYDVLIAAEFPEITSVTYHY
jgi:predicted ATPase